MSSGAKTYGRFRHPGTVNIAQTADLGQRLTFDMSWRRQRSDPDADVAIAVRICQIVTDPCFTRSASGTRKTEVDVRGIVMFSIMFAVMAVIDAAFFKGRYLNDAQTSITSLASISTQIGRR